ncbi:MAG: YkgJ family cysteine cluster protein [Halanaerobiaceae bacterium]
MKIYKNKQNKMDFSGLSKNTTVQDYLTAQTAYLDKHPLKCSTCRDNCCRRNWNLQLDIVFFNRLLEKSNLSPAKTAKKYIKFNPLQRPVFRQFPCVFLDPDDRCSIYQRRALTCRIYTCHEESEKYITLKTILIQTLNITLAVKLKSLQNNISPEEAATSFELAKPELIPLTAKDYNLRISRLISAARGFLPPKSQNLFINL